MKCIQTFTILALLTLIVSCNKDSDQSGCTDHIAVNYDPRALREDGSCQYNQKEQIIWQNGVRGGWNGNLLEGAFRLEVCQGSAHESVQKVDSVEEQRSLLLSTAGGERHLSYFTLLNERNGRDFAEGTLRFDCRIQENASPEYMQLFISGKLPDKAQCPEFARSTYVEISTHSFNDSTFTPVTIPIRHFDKIMMARVNVVCGFLFDGERNTGIEIDNLRWSANRDPD